MAARDFAFCRVCRLNHDQGRKHVFTNRHQSNLTRKLDNNFKIFNLVHSCLSNFKDMIFIQELPDCIWCTFCEKSISNSSGPPFCLLVIEHFSSHEHEVCLKKYFREHKAPAHRLSSFLITKKQLENFRKQYSQWKRVQEDKAELINTHNYSNLESLAKPLASFETLQPKSNSELKQPKTVSITDRDLHSISSLNQKPLLSPTLSSSHVSVDSYFPTFIPHSSSYFEHSHLSSSLPPPPPPSSTSSSTSTTFSSPFNSNSLDNNGVLPLHLAKGNTNLNVNASVSDIPDPRFLSISSIQDQANSIHVLSSVTRSPYREGEKNIHTGGTPPWQKTEESLERAPIADRSFSSIDQDFLDSLKSGFSEKALSVSDSAFSRSRKKMGKNRNPKRVGAEWAEKRRAELLREKNASEWMKSDFLNSLEHGVAYGSNRNEANNAMVESKDDWLPSFGGVWQSGPRRQTRRDFELHHASLQQKVRIHHKGVEPSSPDCATIVPYVGKRARLKENI